MLCPQQYKRICEVLTDDNWMMRYENQSAFESPWIFSNFRSSRKSLNVLEKVLNVLKSPWICPPHLMQWNHWPMPCCCYIVLFTVIRRSFAETFTIVFGLRATQKLVMWEGAAAICSAKSLVKNFLVWRQQRWQPWGWLSNQSIMCRCRRFSHWGTAW